MCSHTHCPNAKNTIGFTAQHPGGKVLNIQRVKQGDAGQMCASQNPGLNRR